MPIVLANPKSHNLTIPLIDIRIFYTIDGSIQEKHNQN